MAELGESLVGGLRVVADGGPQLVPAECLAALCDSGLPAVAPVGQLLDDQELDDVFQDRAVAAVTCREMQPFKLPRRRAVMDERSVLAAVDVVVAAEPGRPCAEHLGDAVDLEMRLGVSGLAALVVEPAQRLPRLGAGVDAEHR